MRYDMSQAITPANSENTPPNDWSHVKETINMLYLAICQIEATMKDSNTSVDTLANSFTAIANHTTDVSNQIEKLNNPEEIAELKRDMAATASDIKLNVAASIQAFQFYDRVCQRLEHVSRSLENVTELMADDSDVNCPIAWRKIQENIKGSYTMEAERIMFEFIMRGGSVKEALEIYQHHFIEGNGPEDTTNDEIELF